MLARMLELELRGRPGAPTVLDLCTGTGVLGVVAARAGASVTAIDVSRRAVLCARLNARLNGVRVEALRGDLVAPVARRSFDVIVTNPPYVPAIDESLPTRGASRAWEAGVDGRALLDRVCAEVPARLAPGGSLLIVQSNLNGTQRTLDALSAAGLSADVAFRERGPLGPLMTAMIPQLEERGLLSPGERHEEVVVIRGRRPSGSVRTRRFTGATGGPAD
jgi:release factor glutamine methyltransferase